MDDERLRTDLILARRIEDAAANYVRAMIDAGNVPERNAALMVTRQAHALVRELEKWMIARAERAATPVVVNG